VFCGIQSTFNKLHWLGNFDLLIVDEAHLISQNATTMYGRFFASARERVPDLRIVGLTASPWRLDSGRLDRGKDAVFEKVVYEINVKELIDQQYLSPLISKATVTALDVSGVHKRGGEFIPGELEAAVDHAQITSAAVKEIVQYGEGRRSWLVFCTGISHANHVREELCNLGVDAHCVFGETPKAERDRLVESFRRGRLRCLVNVGVLGTGFNVPQIDLIALLRPTASAGLFLQQVGRGFRKAPGKRNCLILDFARNTERHGPIDTITANTASRERGDGEPLTKICPECQSIISLSCQQCPDCGYKFSHNSTTHEAVADCTHHILSQSVWLDVHGMSCYKHTKIGSPPSLRVEYDCGSLLVHREWVCLEHSGYPRSKAESWWQRAGGGRPPRDVTEALKRKDELVMPAQIKVRQVGKYFEIEARKYSNELL
jgi:DNA repair protein RadD